MELRDFDINFLKFKNPQESFTYQINDAFFTLKEHSLYSKCALDVEVGCTKVDNTVTLNFAIKGLVGVDCDRCLEAINLSVEAKYTEVLKLTDNLDLRDEDNYIDAGHQIYNVYDTIYEQICLAMPLQKLCENSTKNVECSITYEQDNPSEIIDDRWSELKKLIK